MVRRCLADRIFFSNVLLLGDGLRHSAMAMPSATVTRSVTVMPWVTASRSAMVMRIGDGYAIGDCSLGDSGPGMK